MPVCSQLWRIFSPILHRDTRHEENRHRFEGEGQLTFLIKEYEYTKYNDVHKSLIINTITFCTNIISW